MAGPRAWVAGIAPLAGVILLCSAGCGGSGDGSSGSASGAGSSRSSTGSDNASTGPDAGASSNGSGSGAGSSNGASASGSTNGPANGGSASSTGGSTASGTDGGATGGGGACAPALSSCADDPGGCCAGLACAEDDSGEMRCQHTCQYGTDCPTGCCLEDPKAGAKLCAPQSMCPEAETCFGIGDACEGEQLSCCDGLTCVGSSNPDMAGCRPMCQTAGDCDSGCCIPYSNVDAGFCVAAKFCECAADGETCGGSIHCCDGFACSSGDTPGEFACRPVCKVDGDCDTNCCRPIQMTDTSVCLPSSWCQ